MGGGAQFLVKQNKRLRVKNIACQEKGVNHPMKTDSFLTGRSTLLKKFLIFTTNFLTQNTPLSFMKC